MSFVVLFRFRAQSNVLSAALPLLTHLRRSSTSRTKRSVPFVLPEHFKQHLFQWKQLLEAESLASRERSERIFVEPLTIVLQGTEHRPLSGDHLRFELLSEGDDSLDIQTNSRILIWPKENSQQTNENNGKIACTVHAKRGNLLEVRINSEAKAVHHQLQLREHSEWFLKTNPVNPYQYLVHLLCNPLKMQRLPGFDTLLYTYGITRSEKLKAIKRDKKMWTLSEKGGINVIGEAVIKGNENRHKRIGGDFGTKFNGSQIFAIASAINKSRPFVAIHGPPGTGKTKVIAEIVLQYVKKGKNVLVCAPSHKAVDNAMEACKQNGLANFVRLGDDTDDSALNEFRIGKLAQKHAEYEHILRDSRNSSNIKNRKDFFVNDRHIRSFHSLLRKMDRRKDTICESIGKSTNVIFCTCTSGQALRFVLKGWFSPHLVVMDEASQMVECASWIMLLHAPRFVIVGDHQQLPPFLLSARNIPAKTAERPHRSLLECIGDTSQNEDFYHFLSIQYRSNELIQKWSNRMFYDNKLITSGSSKNIHLRDIVKNGKNAITSDNKTYFNKNWLIDDPLVLVDTDKGITDSKWRKVYSMFKLWHPLSFHEGQNTYTRSYHNSGEALFSVLQIRALHLFGGLDETQIGCITPYSAQSERIQSLIRLGWDNAPRIEVSSVDAFQGQQREAIVMSLVRNNKMHDIGFLREHRRTNVAITRAKRQFFLVASSRMLNSDRMLRELYGVIRKDGVVVGPDDLLPIAQEILEAHSKKNSPITTAVP